MYKSESFRILRGYLHNGSVYTLSLLKVITRKKKFCNKIVCIRTTNNKTIIYMRKYKIIIYCDQYILLKIIFHCINNNSTPMDIDTLRST